MRSPVIAAIHYITTKRTTTIDHQVTNQKALRQAVQFPLQQKNHHAPDFHTVAPGLCTVVFPPCSPTANRVQSYKFCFVLCLSLGPALPKNLICVNCN